MKKLRLRKFVTEKLSNLQRHSKSFANSKLSIIRDCRVNRNHRIISLINIIFLVEFYML